MDAEAVVKEYFSAPYGDRIFVYTNIVTIEDLHNHSFSELLSHKNAINGFSIAMAIHEAIKGDYGSVVGKKVLDVGSSIGHFSFLMAEDGAKVTGVEWFRETVDVARALADIKGLKVEFIQNNIENYLANATDSFDLVLMHNVFDYISIEHSIKVLRQLSELSPSLYTTILIEPQFITSNSMYTRYKKLLSKVYGKRDLWVFWR